jgi:diketogulonate reductase-like aldo/keto reductase
MELIATGYLFDYSGRGVDVVARLAAGKYHRTAAQIYLNWLIAKKQVITIPKAVQIRHLEENADASGWRMETEDYEAVSRAFPMEIARRL